MSRSGYSDDCENIAMWRGAVASAIRGRRGQTFLKEMLAAFDAMPEKKLVAWELEKGGEVCAIGAVGKARGVDMAKLDPEDRDAVGAAFGISPAMACEIVFMNDEANYNSETPEARFARMRQWVSSQIKPEA
jgi:hypothetical protein